MQMDAGEFNSTSSLSLPSRVRSPILPHVTAVSYTRLHAEEILLKKSPGSTIDVNFSRSDSDALCARSLALCASAAGVK